MLNVTWLSEERGAAARATRIFLGGSLSQRGFLVALFEFYPRIPSTTIRETWNHY